jgi:hypothetical protein
MTQPNAAICASGTAAAAAAAGRVECQLLRKVGLPLLLVSTTPGQKVGAAHAVTLWMRKIALDV